MADHATITRRFALKAFPFIGAVVAAPFILTQELKAAPPKLSIEEWLATEDDSSVATYHAVRLSEAMNRVRPGNYFVKVDHDAGLAMVVDHKQQNAHDGPLLADDVTGTTAFADWQKRRRA